MIRDGMNLADHQPDNQTLCGLEAQVETRNPAVRDGADLDEVLVAANRAADEEYRQTHDLERQLNELKVRAAAKAAVEAQKTEGNRVSSEFLLAAMCVATGSRALRDVALPIPKEEFDYHITLKRRINDDDRDQCSASSRSTVRGWLTRRLRSEGPILAWGVVAWVGMSLAGSIASHLSSTLAIGIGVLVGSLATVVMVLLRTLQSPVGRHKPSRSQGLPGEDAVRREVMPVLARRVAAAASEVCDPLLDPACGGTGYLARIRMRPGQRPDQVGSINDEITEIERAELAAKLKRRYDSGESIRKIAAEIGRSYGFVHRVLSESGTALSSREGDAWRRSPSGRS